MYFTIYINQCEPWVFGTPFISKERAQKLLGKLGVRCDIKDIIDQWGPIDLMGEPATVCISMDVPDVIIPDDAVYSKMEQSMEPFISALGKLWKCAEGHSSEQNKIRTTWDHLARHYRALLKDEMKEKWLKELAEQG